ncbi:hypothetical protein ACS0TY_034932 [Phlomoides rotata]
MAFLKIRWYSTKIPFGTSVAKCRIHDFPLQSQFCLKAALFKQLINASSNYDGRFLVFDRGKDLLSLFWVFTNFGQELKNWSGVGRVFDRLRYVVQIVQESFFETKIRF